MRPNIIIFNPDQMRADSLGHLGNPASVMPNIDNFVQNEAVSFRNAYCQNTVCVPSRCSFLTGTYPHTHGHRTMSYLLREGESSLLSELKEAGYYVWMNPRNDFLAGQYEGIFDKHASETFYGGDVDSAPGPESVNPRGSMESEDFYSFYFGRLSVDAEGKNYTIDDESVDEAIRVIKKRSKDRPFCLFLALQLPHPPYAVEEPYFSAIDKAKLPPRIHQPADYEGKASILKAIAQNQHLQSMTEEKWDDIRACYLGMCTKVDDYFGKIIQTLKEESVYDDTAIFLFSDHGDYTGDYGIVEKTQNTFEDCLVNVPLIVKPHKEIAVDPGVTDSLAELIDFYATVVDICELEPDHTHFGRSLRPVLENRKNRHRSYVFSEGGRLQSEIHCNETNGSQPNPYDPYYPRKQAQLDHVAHTKATMIRNERYKYIRRLYEADEFYDLRKDPQEIDNRINDPDYQEIITALRLEMLEWYQATCDAVPFDQDDRFSFEIVWNRVKRLCPPHLEEEVKQKIRDGAYMFELIEWLKRERK